MRIVYYNRNEEFMLTLMSRIRAPETERKSQDRSTLGECVMDSLEELIAEGLAHFRIGCGARCVSSLASYVRELDRWSRTMNLVGLKGSSRVVAELVYDAFFLHSRIAGARSLLDLGSGSGVVSVSMAILDPERRIVSVEKNLKKAQFQRHVKRLLGLDRLEIVHGRIEEAPRTGVDVLIAKAFGPVPVVLDKGRRHLNEGGSAYIVKGKGQKAPAHEGFLLQREESYSLPGNDKAYQLFVYKKVS